MTDDGREQAAEENNRVKKTGWLRGSSKSLKIEKQTLLEDLGNLSERSLERYTVSYGGSNGSASFLSGGSV